MKKKWVDSNIVILGLSRSGIAAAKYLSERGAMCIISEARQSSEDDLKIISELETLGINVEMGGNKEETIQNAEVIITSPGIPLHSKVIKLAYSLKKEVISEIELAYRETTKPFIAITGTNGKTTTTKLVSEIFTNAGYNAPACGNIGIPVCGLLNDKSIDYFVAEMSSYQIEYSPTFRPQIALYLNYTPDHVDWHGSEQAYYDAKAKLFTGSTPPGWAVLNSSDAKVAKLRHKIETDILYFCSETPNTSVFIENNKIIYVNKRIGSENKYETIIELENIPLIGQHNYQNVMAAISIAKIAGIDNDVIKSTISNFKPPEHRLEFVSTLDGIKYYNDSKATNCDSAIWALKAFDNEKVVLIAGGRDKGTDLKEFTECIKKHVSSVILLGEAAGRFEKAIKNVGFDSIFRVGSLEEAIDLAGNLKQGTVLFAPACSSFDMFKNYEERGKAFKDYVKKQSERIKK